MFLTSIREKRLAAYRRFMLDYQELMKMRRGKQNARLEKLRNMIEDQMATMERAEERFEKRILEARGLILELNSDEEEGDVTETEGCSGSVEES